EYPVSGTCNGCSRADKSAAEMARPAAASGSMRCTCQRPNRRAEAGNLDHHGWRPTPFIPGCETVRSLRTGEAVTQDEGTGKATRAIDPREVPGCQSNARKQIGRAHV